MKTIFSLFLLLGLLLTGINTEAQERWSEQKVLVVYFSYTNHTRELAKQIHEQTGGDLIEIEPLTPYSKDYKTVEKQGQDEVNAGYLPPLKTKITDIRSYDVIFIGSPIWWYTITPSVRAFLEMYDFGGKTIVPFITHGGYGTGRSLEDMRKLEPKAIYLKEYAVEGKNVEVEKQKMEQWLKELKF